MWAIWWVWITGALLLGIAELLVPVYIFLGFSMGAVVTGLILWTESGFAAWISASPGRLVVFFALLSLIAWIALRAVLGVRHGQVKIWDRDINED
ncbi:MAG: hypothetical protein AAF748_03260 [Pseudomonadota bacterium]